MQEQYVKLNEKAVLIICHFLFLFTGCKSTDIPNPGIPAVEVRSNLSELQSEQSEINGTAERLDAGINAAASTADRLEAGIRSAAGTASAGKELNTEFEQILNEIRNQSVEPGN